MTTPQFGDLECRLDEKALGHRCGEWRAVLGRAIAQETTADGARFSFPTDAELAVELSRLAAAEMTCCGFLDFTLQITAAGLTLTARAPEGAGQRVGDLLAVLA